MGLEHSLTIKQALEVTVWPPEPEGGEIDFQSWVEEIDVPFFRIEIPPVLQARLTPILVKGLPVGILAHSNTPFILYPRVEYLDSQQGCWLRFPPDGKVDITQQRAHMRIEMSVPIQVKYGPEQLFQLQCLSADLSGGGMKFYSPATFKASSDIRIHLPIDKEQTTVVLRATVVAARDNKWAKSPDMAYIVACRFQDLSEAQYAVIMRECFRREIRRKRL